MAGEDRHRTIGTTLLAMIVLVACAAASDAGNTANSATLQLNANQHLRVARLIDESGETDRFLATRYVDDTPMPALRPAEIQRGYVVFGRHWMDLVFPNSIPKRAEITQNLKTFATPGEYEPVTFCLRTLRDLSGLQVETGELVSTTGNRLAAPVVHVVRCVPRTWQGEESLYKEGPVGVMNMPTYLEPARRADVVAGRTVQYWLTVKVADHAPPGIYQGEIRINPQAVPPYVVDLTVEVLPIALQTPSQTLGFWDFQRPYRGEIGTLDQVYQMMSAHGMNAVFTRAGVFEYHRETDSYDFSDFISISDDGRVTVTLDGSQLAKSLAAAKRAGFKYVIYTPHLPILVRREIADRYDIETLDPQINAEISKTSARFEASPQLELIKREMTLASEIYYPMYSQAYADLYVEIVRKISDEVKRRNGPTLVLSTLDEAYGHHVRRRTAFPYVVRHLELDQRAGAMTILNHCSPFLGGEYGAYVRAAMQHLDIAMPGGRLSLQRGRTSPYNATLGQLVEAFGKQGITTYNYSLSGQAGGVFPDLSVVRFTAGFFFHSLGQGVRGNIDYIYYRPEGDPYNPIDDFHRGDNKRLWSHERLWFFPPQPRSGRLGGRSLSLVAKREGFDDLRYLQTLDTLIERARSKIDSPGAQQAARGATAARNRILQSFTFSDQALDNNQRNLWSRWQMVRATKSQQPTVTGQLRLGIGWDYPTYDQNRRAMAQRILKLQSEIGKPDTD